MAIMRWAPFSPFPSLERDLHDLLDRLGAMAETGAFPWKPSTDVYREDGTLVLKTELPGIDPKTELTIDVEDDVLHIKGEKTVEEETEKANRFIKERRFGSFSRELMLPEDVDPGTITASYDNGILTVVVPLPPETTVEPRKVTVEVIEK